MREDGGDTVGGACTRRTLRGGHGNSLVLSGSPNLVLVAVHLCAVSSWVPLPRLARPAHSPPAACAPSLLAESRCCRARAPLALRALGACARAGDGIE
jgi:hypothetical protein